MSEEIPDANNPTSVAVAFVKMRHEVRQVGETVSQLQETVADFCESAATKTDLEQHEKTCPGRDKPKKNGWAMLQQRLAVIVSITVLLGTVAAAWLWSVKAFNSVESRVSRSDRERKRDRKQIRRDVRELLKAVKEDRGNYDEIH